MRGTDFVQFIKNPHLGQPKWYRDLDVTIAAKEIIRIISHKESDCITWMVQKRVYHRRLTSAIN
jgi:hypothetical protein